MNLLSKRAVEPIDETPPKKPPVMEPIIKKLPLKADQYYQKKYTKKFIVLHHTAGGSAASSIAHWASNPDHIATPYVIDRDGTIYECYSPEAWAYSLGSPSTSEIEKATIPIEICSYGSLAVAKVTREGKYKVGDFVTYTDKVITPEKVVKLDKPFRPEVNPFRLKKNYADLTYEAIYWEAYTPAQIESLKVLLPYLLDRFKIKMQPDRNKFWEYRHPSTLPPGVWSHTTVRKDKIDVFPQKEIVDLIMGL